MHADGTLSTIIFQTGHYPMYSRVAAAAAVITWASKNVTMASRLFCTLRSDQFMQTWVTVIAEGDDYKLKSTVKMF